jgi:regulator of replication initiation timing
MERSDIAGFAQVSTGLSDVQELIETATYVEACRQIDELKAVVGTLISENRYLRDAVDNLRTFDRSHPDNYSGPSLRDSTSEPESESAEPVREASPDITTGESRPVEQINERRPADVPNDDSNSPGIGLSVFNI